VQNVLLRAIPLVLAKHPDCEFFFVGQVTDELRDQAEAAPAAARFLSFNLATNCRPLPARERLRGSLAMGQLTERGSMKQWLAALR